MVIGCRSRAARVQYPLFSRCAKPRGAWDPLDRELIKYNNFLHVAVSHVYDGAGREIALNTNFFRAPNFTNYYDPANNRIGVVESTGDTVSFLYDQSHQLINERRTGTDAYNTSLFVMTHWETGSPRTQAGR